MSRVIPQSTEQEPAEACAVTAPGSLPSGKGNGRSQRVAEDELLVRSCLAGEDGAWEKLYDRCHFPLLRTIESLLGAAARDAATVDEIAARIWYTLVRDDFRLLAAFDGSRDVRLNTFLAGLARIEILRFFRAERRRQTHECRGGRRLLRMRRATVNFDSVMREFAATLTQAERELLESDLTLPDEGEVDPGLAHLSKSAIYQRRHRIRGKLREFFGGE